MGDIYDPCYDSPESERCWKTGCRCLADPDRRGNYKGCCQGGQEGGFTSGDESLACQAFVNRYGKKVGTICPQELPENFYCYGLPCGMLLRGCGPNTDLRIPSPHPACPDEGSLWKNCCVPNVNHGTLGKSVGFSFNDEGLIDNDTPWCRDCTPQEYFAMFDSSDYRLTDDQGKEIHMDIEVT